VNVNYCSCGITNYYANDSICIKCSKEISPDRIQYAKVSPFPDDFATKICECNQTIRRNWESRSLDDLDICNYCHRSRDFLKNFSPLEAAPLFDELDLPYTLDSTKYQYKVITQKDRFFSSKFNPALIERALNEYAQEGWVFKNSVSADFGSLGMSRNELIIFMEKAPDGEINS
jgi:hypothetical protein